MEVDPLAEARERGKAAMVAMVNSGELISAEDMAEKMGIAAVMVDAHRQKKLLLAIDIDGQWYYPKWQIGEDGSSIVGMLLAQICLNMPQWMAIQWFTQPVEKSGPTPLDLLRQGRAELVIRLASHAGEQGA